MRISSQSAANANLVSRHWAGHGLTRMGAVLALAALFQACTAHPRTYSIPEHIDFNVATGEWSVATSGEGVAQDLPTFIAVFSTANGERREGVWMLPSTASQAIHVSKQRGLVPGPNDSTRLIEVPNFVEPDGRGWRIRFADKRVRVDTPFHDEIGPLKMLVPVRRARGERGLDSGIESHVGQR